MSSRSTLKDYFKTNAVPTQNNFSDLMDSVFIQSEDGIRKQATAPVALEAQADNNNNGEQPVLHFYKSFADKDAAWKFSLLNQNNANPASGLSISSATTGQSSLFINDNDGNIGIGTTTPVYKLTLGGTGHFAVDNSSCFLAKNSDAQYETFLWPRWNDDVMYLNYGQQGFNIRNNDSTTAMFIKPEGNIGIGNATPQAKLQVTGGAIMPDAGNSKDAGIYFPENIGGGGGDSAWLRYYIRDNPEGTTLELGISNDPDDHIALMPSGNVGIGTTFPRSKLDMMAFDDASTGTLSSVFARLREGDGNGEGTFLGVRAYGTQASTNLKGFSIEHSFYGLINNSINFYRGGNQTGGYITFNTNNNKEQLRIDNNGNVTYTGTLAKSSDVRIKQNIAKSNTISDLDTVTQLKVKEYHLIDQNTAASSLQKGFIAQEVETILPSAVIKHNNFIPDIFLPAASAVVNESRLVITTPKKHELVTGDIVRLITPAGNKEKIITVISDTAFSVDDWKEDTSNIFVYGKKVDDFRSLDYQQIFTLGISAIQELYKQLQQLGKEMEAIKERLSPAFSSVI